VKDYVEGNAHASSKAVVLTNRKSDAFQINKAIRHELQERKLVGENRMSVDNGEREIDLAVGDRVMLTRNDYKLDVRNGQRGQIQGIDPDSRAIGVLLDGGQEKDLPLDKYRDIDYGWASTTHKAQGSTVDRAYVYGHAKEAMASQQSTYVQISRGREETRIYAVKGEPSIERAKDFSDREPMKRSEIRDEAFKEMEKSWGRNAEKDTTLDYARDAGHVKEIETAHTSDLEMERI
jgi:ATP-dependent exoDNAse (exonuclease V) alpha subunit